MKRWTVMLIPHDRGSTRTLDLSALHFWTLVVLLAGLSFSSSFLYRRQAVIGRQMEVLREAKRELEQNNGTSSKSGENASNQASEVERIRSEYEARISAITSQLSELYDLETQVRQIHGLPPRAGTGLGGPRPSGGKGGPFNGLGDIPEPVDELMAPPPQLIYGLSRPSADLIVQEINLRAESLRELLSAMEAEREQIARMPSIWPLEKPRGSIGSPFGLRRDPITHRLTHHDGVDIQAQYGSPVVATAKGVVVFSNWEKDYGQVIKIDHGNGLTTWYAHLSKRLVEVGDTVERGQLVGRLGSSGRTTGAHLHYEVRRNDRPLDAGKYIGN